MTGIHPLSSLPTTMRHWVIADVHGCHAALQCLLALLPEDDRLIFCGDVINRGPAVAATMETVWSLVERGRAVWLKGNHENGLVRALNRPTPLSRQNLEACETYRQLGDSMMMLLKLDIFQMVEWHKYYGSLLFYLINKLLIRYYPPKKLLIL